MQINPNSSRPKPKRIIGIDFGLSRLGLALSDANKIIASPLMIITVEKRSEQTVQKLVTLFNQIQEEHKCEIETIVVGMPYMMSGKTGFLADEVKHFIQLLSQITPIPIKTWDERLSTVQAERSLREGHMTRKQRSKVVDRISAAIILQSYLDHLHLSQDNSFNPNVL